MRHVRISILLLGAVLLAAVACNLARDRGPSGVSHSSRAPSPVNHVTGRTQGHPEPGARADPGNQAAALATGATLDWWGTVQKQIRESEYHVTWQKHTLLADLPEAYQAPNRAHNLRTYFTNDGIRVIPRIGDAPAWEWGLTLAGYGRAGAMHVPPAAELQTNGNRIEYRRGELTEWYVNDERGLEQGFTMQAPPAPLLAKEQLGGVLSASGAPLRIDLRVTGNLTGRLSADAQRIEFTTPGGVHVVNYGELKAADARSHKLPVRFVLAGDRLSIVVDDNDAAYPVTIDPLATSPNWSCWLDQAGAAFGCSVATAGDVNGDGYSDVIIGAEYEDLGTGDEGRAYVFHGSASGLPAAADWIANGRSGSRFGHSVATAGDVNGDGYSDVIVGSPSYSNGQSGEGGAFVFHGSASGLSTTANWTAESNQASAHLGWSVATAGDVNGDGYSDVIVGAPYAPSFLHPNGQVFVYHGSALGLSAAAAWTVESDRYEFRFGWSVASAGDVNGDGYSDVIAGGVNDGTDLGLAAVFHGSAAGLSTAANWGVESTQADLLGASVATAGDVNGDGYSDVIVGAPGYYSNGQYGEGGAFVYHGSPGGLNLLPNWIGESGQIGAAFGVSVATAGDVNGDGYSDVIVGAMGYTNGEEHEGGAFVCYGSAAGLNMGANWSAESNEAEAWFGKSVATAGDVNGDGFSEVIVGASYWNVQRGRAYTYHGGPSGLSTGANFARESDQEGAYFGYSVKTAGDVNGDGYSDVIVGAYGYDNGEPNEGRAFVYHGSAAGPSATADWTAEGNQADAWFGFSVASAGDVNGDGYGDVAVGACFYDNGQTDEGRAYVYHGSASGLGGTPAWTAESDQAQARLGVSVATAGDVNGDGYSDLVVGANWFSNGETREGRAIVYHGSAAGLSTAPNWTGEGNQADAYYGFPVATAGDVNGDGYSDVIVAANSYDNGQSDEGRVFVYHGSAAGLGAIASWAAEGDQADAHFGFSVATAGDVNGDGYSDVIVGADAYDNGELNEGRAFVYHGGPLGLSNAVNWSAESNQAGAAFGYSVATAGDVNADGYSEVIVGAHAYTNGQSGEGAAFVYHGSASGLSPAANWTAEGNQADALFGVCVATAGDVNGDGYSDVIVGAMYFDNGEIDEGGAFLYYGNGGAGLGARPQQRRADDLAPIGPLGKSDAFDGFRLAALGRSPFGRAHVKLQWEVKPLGTLFDGTGTNVSSAYADTGLTGVSLNDPVTGLSEHTAYHWRVRLLYHPAIVPFMPHSRWFSLAFNGWQETDLRTFPCSSFARLDFDADCDVDSTDLSQFEACATGPGIPGPPVSGCTAAQFDAADRDDDNDVDQSDFAIFQRCYSGPDVPADPNCME